MKLNMPARRRTKPIYLEKHRNTFAGMNIE